jgi:hypothetical protein
MLISETYANHCRQSHFDNAIRIVETSNIPNNPVIWVSLWVPHVWLHTRRRVHNLRHEKLIVAQLVKKFPTFKEPEGSLSCSQKPVKESVQTRGPEKSCVTSFLRWSVISPRPTPKFEDNLFSAVHYYLLNMFALPSTSVDSLPRR